MAKKYETPDLNYEKLSYATILKEIKCNKRWMWSKLLVMLQSVINILLLNLIFKKGIVCVHLKALKRIHFNLHHNGLFLVIMSSNLMAWFPFFLISSHKSNIKATLLIVISLVWQASHYGSSHTCTRMFKKDFVVEFIQKI